MKVDQRVLCSLDLPECDTLRSHPRLFLLVHFWQLLWSRLDLNIEADRVTLPKLELGVVLDKNLYVVFNSEKLSFRRVGEDHLVQARLQVLGSTQVFFEGSNGESENFHFSDFFGAAWELGLVHFFFHIPYFAALGEA